MKRAFASLDPHEALHVAIFIEERNAEIYHRFAEMFVEFRDSDSLEIASVFWDMAIEEKQHSSLLQAKYTEQYGNASCSLTEENLEDFIGIPQLESGDVFAAVDKNNQVTARERALQVALTAEISAHRYYSQLAERTQDPSLRRLYQELSDMEDGHVTFIQGKLTPHETKDKAVN
jgi:rubrerythrin